MKCFQLLFVSLFVLAVNTLSGQPLEEGIRAILNSPRDSSQLVNLNEVIKEKINTGGIVPDTLFDHAQTLAKALGASRLSATLYLNRSMYDLNTGSVEKGLVHVGKAIENSQALNNENLLASSYNIKLRLMMTRGDIEEAADLATDLIKKYHDSGDKNNEARTYLLLSRLSTSLGEYPMTLTYDVTAIKLSREVGDVGLLAESLYSSAENWVLLDYPEKGLKLAEEAMMLAKENDLKYVFGNIINARMGANIKLGKYAEALSDYETLAELEGEQKFAWWMTTRGLLLQRIGRNDEARELLTEAVELIKKTSNSPISLKRAYLGLQTVDLNQAQYDSVVWYQAQIRAQDDSLHAARNTRHMLELEEKYQAGEKDAAINLQREELNTQQLLLFASVVGLLIALGAVLGFFLLSQRLKKKNRENELLLRDKETLIGEIHHRVKNNLQVISSLLQIQRSGLDSDDDKGREALLESQNRVSAMGLIHNKLYQGKRVTSVGMLNYLEDLGETLLNAYRIEEQVEIFYDVADISLDVDTAIPIGLIINELVTNSIKYAFPMGREGTIEIFLQEENNQLRLKVTDDGVGAVAAEKRADSTLFGKNLIGLLTKKLKGTLAVLDGKGYGVEISFKG